MENIDKFIDIFQKWKIAYPLRGKRAFFRLASQGEKSVAAKAAAAHDFFPNLARAILKGDAKMKISFFLPMKTIPTVTSQEKGVNFSAHRIFTKPEVLDVKQKYISLLTQYRPDRPMLGSLKLTVVWCFPPQDRAPAGTYKATKPDTDNMIKLLKDCMTELGFWTDDAQVAVEYLSKGYDDPSGIFIEVQELEDIFQ